MAADPPIPPSLHSRHPCCRLHRVPRPLRKARIYTRPEIEALIANGRHIVILGGKVLMCDAWLRHHPGGDKAIKHMVGRDATDEVTALHSPEAIRRMDVFQIGRVEGRWLNFVPPVQGGKFRTKPELEDSMFDTTFTDAREGNSSQQSSDASPVFESFDRDSVKRRCVDGSPFTHTPSSTSISSIELEEPPGESVMSFFNAKTQQEISLDADKYPPLSPDVQDEIVRKYRVLGERFKTDGLYQCRYTSYLIELCRYVLLFVLFLGLLKIGWYCSSAFFLGCFWQQLVFSAHDAGHIAITHDYHTDSVIGIVIADFLGGLSLGWWKRNHNIHHIVTNHAEHDPDIQHLPFFAISTRFFESLTSTYYDKVLQFDAASRLFVRFQHVLYYPILCFGRFNLYRLSWVYLFSGQAPSRGPAWWHRYFEIIGQAFFWYWFGYQTVYKSVPSGWTRLAFVLVSHMVTMLVHVQITLSHFAMSTADLGIHESFPQKMLRTTMDIDCPAWLDFLHGGLQFQAVHHLFPRVPRHNLRRAQRLVVAFCDDVGIPYSVYGFADGNRKVTGHLGDVARQASILAACQKSMAQRGDYGM